MAENHVTEATTRPSGANADEWRLFLSAFLDSRATSVDGLSFVAVQIAEAIEAERERCVRLRRTEIRRAERFRAGVIHEQP